MNQASRWRMELAKRTIRPFQSNPKVVAAIVTGSVAYGISDAYSDTDLLLFCDRMPQPEEREAASRNAGARNRVCLQDSPVFVREHYTVGHAKVDASFLTTEAVEAVLVDVLEGYDTDPLKHKLMVALQQPVPLSGESQIQTWKERVTDFPDGLAKAMVEKYLPRYPLWVLEHQGVGRNDDLYLHELMWPIINNLYGTCLGLNRHYHPSGFKHFNRHLQGMKLLPNQFGARLRRIVRTEPPKAIKELKALLQDTCELVGRHMPETDAKRAWATISDAAPRADGLPEPPA